MRLPSGSFAGFTKSVAPIFFAHASLPGLVSTAMMREALTCADVAITPKPMAPQPKTATVLLAALKVSCVKRHWEARRRTDPGLLDDCSPGGGDTTAEQAYTLERGRWAHRDERDIGDYCVLRERRGAHLGFGMSVCDRWTPKRNTHKVVNGLSFYGEANGFVWHQATALSSTYCAM